MDMLPDPIRKHMWAHLRDLMHDGQRFGWPTVRTFHAVRLQHIEQGRATWRDNVHAGPQFSAQPSPCFHALGSYPRH